MAWQFSLLVVFALLLEVKGYSTILLEDKDYAKLLIFLAQVLVLGF
jgi:hypothetical protein